MLISFWPRSECHSLINKREDLYKRKPLHDALCLSLGDIEDDLWRRPSERWCFQVPRMLLCLKPSDWRLFAYTEGIALEFQSRPAHRRLNNPNPFINWSFQLNKRLLFYSNHVLPSIQRIHAPICPSLWPAIWTYSLSCIHWVVFTEYLAICSMVFT